MRWNALGKNSSFPKKLFDSCCDDRSTVDCKISGKKIKKTKKKFRVVCLSVSLRFPWKEEGTLCNGRLLHRPTWIYCKKTTHFEGISTLFTPSGLWGFNWDSNKKIETPTRFFFIHWSSRLLYCPHASSMSPRAFIRPAQGDYWKYFSYLCEFWMSFL